MSSTTEEKALKCIRCGFCLDACPTFRLTGNEADSPRGRIYLMRSVQQGDIPLDNSVVKHLDSCLACRACETACPSGVEYASILEQFRTEIENQGMRPGANTFARKQLLGTLTSPTKLVASLSAQNLFTKVTGSDKMPSVLSEMLSGGSKMPITLPATPEKVKVGQIAEISKPYGKKRYRVGVLAGCVMRVLFHETNDATVRVLQENGCEVVAPQAAGCCGALHLHYGFTDDAKVRARKLIDVFESVEMDAFVVNSAGCGSSLKEYGHILEDDPVYAEKAARFASKVKDISEFLMEIGIKPPQGSFDAVVAYHDACHLAHGQKITGPPRQLLQQIPGLKMVDLPESDTCCGSAGIYNLTQPEMARQLLDRKVDFIEETRASVVVTSNPGCIAWILQGVRERGLSLTVKHPIEVLDEAYQNRK